MTRSPKRRTPKERVLATYPKAFAWEFCKRWSIWNSDRVNLLSGDRISGHHETERAAWADAARRIKK